MTMWKEAYVLEDRAAVQDGHATVERGDSSASRRVVGGGGGEGEGGGTRAGGGGGGHAQTGEGWSVKRTWADEFSCAADMSPVYGGGGWGGPGGALESGGLHDAAQAQTGVVGGGAAGQTSRKGGLKTWLMMTLFCTSLPRSYAPYAPRPSSPSRSLLHLSLSMSLSLSLSRSRVWSRSCFRSKLRSRSRLLCSCSIKVIQNVLIKRIVRETQS